MAFDNGYTAVTGGTLSAAQWNTYVRDNFTALWPFTTAGDLAYAASATSLSRLGLGAAYKGLVVNSGGAAPEWNQPAFVTAAHTDNTGHSYSTNTARDMPNSSATITLLTQSTIIVWGAVSSYGTGTFGNRIFWFSIDGTNVGSNAGSGEISGYGAAESYQISERVTSPIVGRKTGVAAGARTIKIREQCPIAGYTVENLHWIALAIPERS